MSTDPLDRALEQATEEVDPKFAAALRDRLLRQMGPVFEGETTMPSTEMPTIDLTPADHDTDSAVIDISTVRRNRPNRTARTISWAFAAAPAVGVGFVAVNRPTTEAPPAATQPGTAPAPTRPSVNPTPAPTTASPPATTAVPDAPPPSAETLPPTTAASIAPPAIDKSAVLGVGAGQVLDLAAQPLTRSVGDVLGAVPGLEAGDVIRTTSVSPDGRLVILTDAGKVVLVDVETGVFETLTIPADGEYHVVDAKVGPANMLYTQEWVEVEGAEVTVARVAAVPLTGDRRGQRLATAAVEPCNFDGCARMGFIAQGVGYSDTVQLAYVGPDGSPIGAQPVLPAAFTQGASDLVESGWTDDGFNPRYTATEYLDNQFFDTPTAAKWSVRATNVFIGEARFIDTVAGQPDGSAVARVAAYTPDSNPEFHFLVLLNADGSAKAMEIGPDHHTWLDSVVTNVGGERRVTAVEETSAGYQLVRYVF